jgi:ATP dependent DNA ligase domain
MGCWSHLRDLRRSRQSVLVLVDDRQRPDDKIERSDDLGGRQGAVSEGLGRVEGMGEAGVVEAVNHLKVRSCLIDGEVVCCDEEGVTSFQLRRHRRNEPQAFLFAFDLLELNGADLRREPIEVRKATLASILRKGRPGVCLNEHLEHDCGLTVFQHACKMGLEGIVLATGIALPNWALSRLVEVQEPRRARGEAGGGGGLAMSNRRGPKGGTPSGDRRRFPYEPRVVGGKLLMPAELQAIRRYVVETPVLNAVTEEIRAVVETVWPELISKLPPKLRDVP